METGFLKWARVCIWAAQEASLLAQGERATDRMASSYHLSLPPQNATCSCRAHSPQMPRKPLICTLPPRVPLPVSAHERKDLAGGRQATTKSGHKLVRMSHKWTSEYEMCMFQQVPRSHDGFVLSMIFSGGGGSNGQKSAWNAVGGFNPQVRRSPWRRE